MRWHVQIRLPLIDGLIHECLVISLTCEDKRFFYSFFLGFEYFAWRFNRPFDKNDQNKFSDPFFGPPGNVFGQQGVYMVELVAVFVSNILKCFSYSCDILQ